VVYRRRVTKRPTGPSDAERPEPDRPGETYVAGRYLLGPIIGRGGMATIYRAEDTRLGKAVALKLLRPEITADRDLSERFRREALAATVLRHPNIVACLDTGSDPAGPYMVMELIEGEDLAARLRRSGAINPLDATRIGLDVARGLGVAHVRGIVHRDVKPSNILLGRDGRAMITDFGIARLAADAEATLPGTTLGSIHYFSPEQAQGLATTAATDVYGLGLVLYEALTGRRPFHGTTNDEIALARVGAAAPSPRDVRPDVPLAIDAIVLRMLAAEPMSRYANGAAVVAALEPLVAAGDRATTTTRVASGVVAAPAFVSEPPSEPPAVPPAVSQTGSPPARVMPRPPVPSRQSSRRPAAAHRRRSDGGLLRSLTVFGIMGVVVTLIGIVVLPRVGDALGGSAGVIDTPSATAPRTAKPTKAPTARPTARPTATPTPTPIPTPVDASLVEPLCAPAPDPCALDVGWHAPATFGPGLQFQLGPGWSTVIDSDGLVVVSRPEGLLTIASGISLVDASQSGLGDGHASDLVKAFIATDGVTATHALPVTIGGVAGRSTDVTPRKTGRRAMFRTGTTTYFVEVGRTTRLVALDVGDRVIVIAIEPSKGHTLKEILATADVVAASLRFP
jgi:eukaryotic-like serine/threonine-protein kinase